MPIMGGADATRRIRQLEAEHRLQSNLDRVLVIGCSANCDSFIVEEALAAGMDAFIAKPVTAVKFAEALRALGHVLPNPDVALL